MYFFEAIFFLFFSWLLLLWWAQDIGDTVKVNIVYMYVVRRIICVGGYATCTLQRYVLDQNSEFGFRNSEFGRVCFFCSKKWKGSDTKLLFVHQLQGCRNRGCRGGGIGGTVSWMGFYVDISWESRCYSEIKVWGHLCQILVVFEVPARPQVKGMSGNS